MKPNKIYHKERYQSVVRQVHKINDKIIIILVGQYAFKYTVTIKKQDCNKSLTLANRNLAIKEISMLKQQYKQFGDCNFHY